MEVDELPRMVKMNICTVKVENDHEEISDSKYGAFVSSNETPNETRHWQHGFHSLNLHKRAVVVLNRLPEYISDALLPVEEQCDSEHDSHGNSDSDMLWEPDGESVDSDFASKCTKSTSKKKEKTSNSPKCSTKDSPAAATSSSGSNGGNPIIVSSVFGHCSKETNNVRPDLPEVQITVDMMVLARKRAMRWQRGKVMDIVLKDGRLKYKVGFEEKGRSLVSGHHIAFDTTPKLEELYVGARIVVSSADDAQCFQPGVLAELPSRKNRLRFLVFLDDHTPIYVGLPSLHLVCRPLDDVLDDIPESPHRVFLVQYLKNWPYPHLTHYKVGQSIKVELDGVQTECEVEAVDSSLMNVVFQDSQCKEWVHRGSVRLEHMAKFLDLRDTE
ncbi:histone-lysine N-methyltransferase SETDB1-B-like isoform X2 [Cololabis saira]|uniref:histone-lysine N-methyltransferase SETDB1-B-like isoform X2 n=1 Tax=Cololabis saira TaxID=129043 RepID=UPI002AD4BE26|nr:histone-lysine N-methyltransferase SETDB1-B-like isoform X2 [Cololabis saira]